MNAREQFIDKAYTAFNKRNIDGVLVLMHTDVDWPNGWEGGYVHGHDAVRDYWTRQWKEIDPEVWPLKYEHINEITVKVSVHQKVKDMSGKILMDKNVIHIYFFQDGLIKRMEIVE